MKSNKTVAIPQNIDNMPFETSRGWCQKILDAILEIQVWICMCVSQRQREREERDVCVLMYASRTGDMWDRCGSSPLVRKGVRPIRQDESILTQGMYVGDR